MKRLIAIAGLALYLFTATECRQLLKFPVLMQHFTEHKAWNGRISFLDFLYMHYAGSDFNDNDQDRDRQLPFKSYESSAADDFQPLPLKAGFLLCCHPPMIARKHIVFKCLNLQSSYFAFIWQPPKAFKG